MRIQRQAEVFSWRFAEAPVAPQQAYSDEAWQQRLDQVNATLAALFNHPDGPRDTRNLPQFGAFDPVTKRTAWSADRKAKQDRLLAAFVAGRRAGGKQVRAMADIPREHRGLLAGGVSGAGKTTILKDPRTGIKYDDWFSNNVDDLKELAAEPEFGLTPSDEEMPELASLSPMERTPLIHFEMQDLIDRLAQQALKDGTNMIYDNTMSKGKAVQQSIDDLKRHGYGVGGLFVKIDPEEALGRVSQRHREGETDRLTGKGSGGRPVPSYVSLAQKLDDPMYTTVNEKMFDQYANMPGAFDQGWIKYDNGFDQNYVDPANPANQGPKGPIFSRPRVLGSSNSGMFNNAIPALTAHFRRVAEGEYQHNELDPHSVRGLLDMYEDGYIDFRDLVGGITQVYLTIDWGEDQHWADQWLEAEGPADPNSGTWIDHAVARGVINQQQGDLIFAQIGRAIAEKDSVGEEDALPGAGAAAPVAAPSPTLSREARWWLI